MNKVIDCFIFYNELELLKFRLTELNDYVDYFVLVESRKTHSGNDKELYYENNKHLFQEYNDKIIHIIEDDLPIDNPTYGFKDLDEQNIKLKLTPARIREENQRNGITKGLDLLKLDDNDIVIISDMDEIINPDIILKYKNENFDILIPQLDFYIYDLTYKYPKIWTLPKIVKYKICKYLTPEDIRLTTRGEIVERGGWHFTYFFGTQNIINKIKNFSHQELNNEFYTDEKYIEDCIKTGKYIFDDTKLEYIDIKNNKNLPKNYNLLNKNRKYCFLITSYCDTDKKIEVLNECIDNLKKISNIDILLHAHYPIKQEIQTSVKYYLYDSSNPILKYPEKYITWWRTFDDITLNIYKDDYGFAVLQQWNRGFYFLRNLYDYIIILNYDVIITKKLLEQILNKSNLDGCTFLHENGNTIAPLLSINSKSNIFEKISIEEYKKVNGFAESFIEYLFLNTKTYRFAFNEYKDDYYTMIDFEGDIKFKDNKLSTHYSPYNIFNFDNLEIFVGEKDNKLNFLFYNLKNNLSIKILYNKNEIYDNNLVVNNWYLFNSNIQFDQIDIDQINIFINEVELVFDKKLIKYCKIIK